MNGELGEWLSLLLRWTHVIAGIMWIGQTYLFNWMERSFTPPQGHKPNIAGELWMVHGGGFYLVEKQIWPELMPRKLHWFKWEAMMSWISGFLLLMLVYWAGAPLLPYGSDWSRGAGIGASVSVLVGGVLLYRLIWNTAIGTNDYVGIAVSWMAIVAAAYGLGRVFSDRAVYLHIGAAFGTIMVTNVWLTIIPNQKRIMRITEAGGAPDQSLALAAKRCSKHNTFLSVPLIFTMISNHYPSTFGGPHGELLLGALVAVGWIGAYVIREYL